MCIYEHINNEKTAREGILLTYRKKSKIISVAPVMASFQTKRVEGATSSFMWYMMCG